jgi:hypothetical protein
VLEAANRISITSSGPASDLVMRKTNRRNEAGYNPLDLIGIAVGACREIRKGVSAD